MRRTFVISILTVIMFIVGYQPSFAAADVERAVIVHFANEEGKQATINASTDIITSYDHLQMLAVTMNNSELVQLQKHPDIVTIETNDTVQLLEEAVSISPTFATTEANQWNITAVNSSVTWQEGLTGKGVKIAIIDSGIASHNDLSIAGGVSFISDDYDDEHGHGTHIAGIIGAQHNGFGAAGIAPNSEIYAVRVLDKEGVGDVAHVLQGIDWAIENGMDIINLSFGDTSDLGPLKEAIQTAYSKGILVVAASGNNGTSNVSENTVFYPALYDEVIAVAALDQNFSRSGWSATGPKNEFTAPGEGVYSTFLNDQFATKQGTSVAAPHVVGVLALLKEKYPYLSNDELRLGLQVYVRDLGATGRDELYGYGLVHYVTSSASSPQEAQLVTEALQSSSAVTVEQARTAVNNMKASTTKLELINELNSIHYKLLQHLRTAITEFEKRPSTTNYERVEALLSKMEETNLKAEAEKNLALIMEQLSESAVETVNTFEKNKTVVNYNRAAVELATLPKNEVKNKLAKQLEEALYIMVASNLEVVEAFEKAPTAKSYKVAQVAINNIPASELRTSLNVRLQQQVKTLLAIANSTVEAYENHKSSQVIQLR
ncbi:S8 family peptidase [Solibacillus sp. FSL H8-0538]|uniref:S8 family peptidase n=1 Tax=Solibacillus sp. FSL H8-0538 TaxID=2921400 RepID=UPI0030FAA4B9